MDQWYGYGNDGTVMAMQYNGANILKQRQHDPMVWILDMTMRCNESRDTSYKDPDTKAAWFKGTVMAMRYNGSRGANILIRQQDSIIWI